MTNPNATACAWPSLGYRNAPHMIEWLVEAFGLTKDLVVAGADGEVAHSELGWRGAVINVVSYTDGEDTLTTVPGKAGLYLVVDDPDAHHDHARAAGATIVRPLTDHDYGSRGYTARDPEGNAWSFGTYAGVLTTGETGPTATPPQ
jgi:uncharacterized glyoxalase superfamily protein PhnB